MVDWEKNFAIIVRTSSFSHLRDLYTGKADLGNAHENDPAFGHAVIILKIGDDLYYRGYRPTLADRGLREALGANDKSAVIDILRKGVTAEICDERSMYQEVFQTALPGFVYHYLNYKKKEVDAIWTQVKQDEEKEDKYYTLEPDTARQSGEFAEDSLVHNCVTWIIETQHVSVNRFLLKRVRNGNISQFAENLHQTGDSL
ncbi:hypothetical protein F4X88_11765 [Candidatus Poribacteria bacterium]|nr:hypothetical protein [Candidatus Poribacteria bacterium]MYA56968.1 hypothetical protein [Candidatus Poribacteria bacterium]